jgi:hypothetical protein
MGRTRPGWYAYGLSVGKNPAYLDAILEWELALDEQFHSRKGDINKRTPAQFERIRRANEREAAAKAVVMSTPVFLTDPPEWYRPTCHVRPGPFA